MEYCLLKQRFTPVRRTEGASPPCSLPARPDRRAGRLNRSKPLNLQEAGVHYWDV